MKLNLDKQIQDPELLANGAGDYKYTLYVYDSRSNVDYYIRFKTRDEVEDRLTVLFSAKQGVVSPKVRFLLHDIEGTEIPHINDRYLYRVNNSPYEYFIEDGSIHTSRILFVIMTHDD